MAHAIITRRGRKSYTSVLLADVTLGSAQTTIDLTGLNLVKGEVYTLVMTCIVDGSTNMLLYVNSDTTGTNYTYQRWDGNGTGIGGTRGTTPIFIQFGTSAQSLAVVDIIYSEDGYFVYQSETMCNYNLANNQRVENFCGGSIGVHDPITRLQITSSSANRLQSGTRVQLYREAK